MSTETLSNGWKTDAAWSPIAKMSTKRQNFAAVALNDHQCLVMGGGYKGTFSWHVFSSVELYEKTTNTWTKLPHMKQKRYGHAAVVVGNVVYAIGGWNGKQCLASVEVLDLNKPPEQRKWTVLKQTMTTRRDGCAAAIVGRNIYIMGGWDDASFLSSIEIFDIETQEWSIGPSMTTARHGCAAVAIGTTVYAIGGQNINDENFDTVECLNVLAMGNNWKWTLLPQGMASKRWSPAVTVIGCCTIVVGGCSTGIAKDNLGAAELWDPKYQKWMLLPSMSTARFGGAAVTLGTTVLVMGGLGTTGNSLSLREQLNFSDISRIQTRTELNTIISNLELQLTRARVHALYSPSRTSYQAVQSMSKELKARKGFQEHIKDQLLTIEELHKDIESLHSAYTDAMLQGDLDKADKLVSQLSLQQSQLEKEEVVMSRDKVDKALISDFPHETEEIASHYLDQITNDWRSRIGTGGFGTIFKGVDTVTGNKIAVKRLQSRRICPEAAFQEFGAEIKAWCKLSHPNVIRLLAYATKAKPDGIQSGHDGEYFYLVYEHPAGGPMHRLLRDETARAAFDWQLRVQACASLVSALQYLYAHGFCQHDLKLCNIYFKDTSLRQLVLMDFGLTASMNCLADNTSATTEITSRTMTRLCPAPDKLDTGKCIEMSTVFSVGVLIATLITGRSKKRKIEACLETQNPVGSLIDTADKEAGLWKPMVLSGLAESAVASMSATEINRPCLKELESKLHDLKLKSQRRHYL